MSHPALGYKKKLYIPSGRSRSAFAVCKKNAGRGAGGSDLCARFVGSVLQGMWFYAVSEDPGGSISKSEGDR
jgi:hypothetical protein